MRSETHEYRNHTIILRVASGAEHAHELLVDGRPVGYGRLTDGRYVLDEYAHEPQRTLQALAERFIDHRHPPGPPSVSVTSADEGE